MSIQAIISRRESERLSAEVMQYLKAGGQIEKVPGFQKIKPKPLPEEKAKRPEAIRDREYISLVAEIRRMAADRYSKRYAAICLGISPWKVDKVARENGIAFRHDPTKINRI
tara:strand:+ start:62302 stop:62637 length:336 start_codon:yes stop_codon:yes gene_type:complete